MNHMSLNQKTDIRSLLLTFDNLVELVGNRIRPDYRDEADGNAACIVIEIPNGDQYNDLDGIGGLVNLDVLFRCIAPTAMEADEIAERLRTNQLQVDRDNPAAPGVGLDGYLGPAGTNGFLQANRVSWSTDAIPDEDGQPTAEHEHAVVYEAWHQTLI